MARLKVWWAVHNSVFRGDTRLDSAAPVLVARDVGNDALTLHRWTRNSAGIWKLR